MAEEIITTQAYEPDENGIWSGPFYIDVNGQLTHDPAQAVDQTDAEPPLGYVWCFNTRQWIDPARQHGSGFEYEIQYIDGVETKRNYTVDAPEHALLLAQYAAVRNETPSVLSEKNGKLTAYAVGDGVALALEFGADLRDWGPVHAINLLPDGRQSVKLYDQDIYEYVLPLLPEGTDLSPAGAPPNGIYGVACTWIDGVESDDREIYFLAARDAVEAWAAPLGLPVPEASIDYWGVVFNGEGTILHLKALKWVRAETGPVEKCWVAGSNIRTGYCGCDEARQLLAQIPQGYVAGQVMNVGANEYDLGPAHGVHEIISVYFKGQLSEYHRNLFSVPYDVIAAPWYGIKYCPDYACEWLKLADLRYDQYTLPPIPENAERAFGVATTYAKTGTQPPVHNGEGDGWRDCSFITRDHAAVRRWCLDLGLADPAPHLPDTLILLGVYSVTHHATTGEIKRVKFYDYYTAQRFEMELYLSGVLAGRQAEKTFDEPLFTMEIIQGARDRVVQFNSSEVV